jgi:uncharacterized protein YkwD
MRTVDEAQHAADAVAQQAKTDPTPGRVGSVTPMSAPVPHARTVRDDQPPEPSRVAHMRRRVGGAVRHLPWVVGGVVAALMLAALAGPVAPPPASTDAGGGGVPARGGCTVGASWVKPNAASGAAVLRLVNQRRARIGARPLKAAPTLTNAAVWKSSHMMRFRYFSHNDAAPASRTTGQRLSACGYHRGTWAENLAVGQRTPSEVVSAWVASPGHRANIDNKRYTTTGIGAVAKSGRPTQWTQTFGIAPS